MNNTVAATVILSSVWLSACGSSMGVDLAAERAALRATAEAYHEAASTRDVDRLVALYATDALMIPPDQNEVEGHDAVREFATAFMQAPGLTFNIRNVIVEVAASGDMGYTLEDLVISVDGPDGEPIEDQLRDIHLWKRQNGEWKLAIDIWNSGESEPGA